MKKILAISAHSDDVEFYAGGTLLKMAENDWIILVVATDGRNGGNTNADARKVVAQRKQEQKVAARLLGVAGVRYLNFRDGQLERDIPALKQKLLRILLTERPDIVFSFDPEKQYAIHADFHPDHRALSLAVLDTLLVDATLPKLTGAKPLQRPKIYLYNASRPNMKVDASRYWKRKRQILLVFKSQVLKLPVRESGRYFERFRVY